jgi:hypothetical protein
MSGLLTIGSPCVKPGIGKSHLCALLVARTLIEGKTVLFERHNIAGGGSARSVFTRLRMRPSTAACYFECHGIVATVITGSAGLITRQAAEPMLQRRRVTRRHAPFSGSKVM